MRIRIKTLYSNLFYIFIILNLITLFIFDSHPLFGYFAPLFKTRIFIMAETTADIVETVNKTPEEIAQQFLDAPTVAAAQNFGSDLPVAMDAGMKIVQDLGNSFNSFVKKYTKVVEEMDGLDPVAARQAYYEISAAAGPLTEKTGDASEACWAAVNSAYAAAQAVKKITAHFGDSAKAEVVNILKDSEIATMKGDFNEKLLDTVGAMTEAYTMEKEITKIRNAAMEKAYPSRK